MANREERLAQNEVLFRQVNERIMELDDEWHLSHDLICECANTGCMAVMRMSLAEYRSLRLDSHRFGVLPGHEIPDIEDVIERNDRYLVVEKHADTHEIVDP
jgi:hypothetical protein